MQGWRNCPNVFGSASRNRYSNSSLVRLSPEVQQTVDAQPHLRDALDVEFSELLEQVNATSGDHQMIGYAVVAKATWITENGLLTPTLKFKHTARDKRYFADAEARRALGRKVISEKQPHARRPAPGNSSTSLHASEIGRGCSDDQARTFSGPAVLPSDSPRAKGVANGAPTRRGK